MSSFTTGGEYLVPKRIHADRANSTLELEWPDGHVSRYDFETLRWLCPCAFCRGEAGIPGWLDSNPTLTPAQTQLTDLQLVGSYALQPTWADGHHTGFYTFQRLRDECPCAGGRRAPRRMPRARPASDAARLAATATDVVDPDTARALAQVEVEERLGVGRGRA